MKSKDELLERQKLLAEEFEQAKINYSNKINEANSIAELMQRLKGSHAILEELIVEIDIDAKKMADSEKVTIRKD